MNLAGRTHLKTRMNSASYAPERPAERRHHARRDMPPGSLPRPTFLSACFSLRLNAAAAEGITSIATVHHCFGCLSSTLAAVQSHRRRSAPRNPRG
jgi:hypothetical protein